MLLYLLYAYRVLPHLLHAYRVLPALQGVELNANHAVWNVPFLFDARAGVSNGILNPHELKISVFQVTVRFDVFFYIPCWLSACA